MIRDGVGSDSLRAIRKIYVSKTLYTGLCWSFGPYLGG